MDNENLPDKKPPVKHNNPINQRDWWRYISRNWTRHISPAELSLLAFIFDRTFGWNKAAEQISRKQFRDGVQGHDGRFFHRGTGLSDSTIKRSISSMLNSGIILRYDSESEVRQGTPYYEINLSWNPPEMLTTPKRLKTFAKTDEEYHQEGGQNEPPGGGQNEPPGGVKMNPLRSNKKGKKEKREEAEGSCEPQATRVGLAEVKEMAQEIQKRKEGKREARKAVRLLNKKDISALWLSTLRAFHPDASSLPLSIRESSALWQKQRLWNDAYPSGDTFALFLCFVIEHWSSFMVREFGWMKEAPQAPSIWFFLGKFHGRFAEAYGKRKQKLGTSLSWTEVRVAQLLSLGLSRPEAVARAAQEDAQGETPSKASGDDLRRLTAERINLERERRKASLEALSKQASRRKVRVDIPDKFPEWESEDE